MTTAKGDDAQLAVVTDLFGGGRPRSRRYSEQPAEADLSRSESVSTDADSPAGPDGDALAEVWAPPVTGTGARGTASAVPLSPVPLSVVPLFRRTRGTNDQSDDGENCAPLLNSDSVDFTAAVAQDMQRADAERITMRALARKGVSVQEMRSLLAAQNIRPDAVEAEVERLSRVRLLDDVALAAELVERLRRRKGLGRQGIIAELRHRGIDQGTADAALDAGADEGDDELDRAIAVAQQRARSLRSVDQQTAQRRLTGYLMRKGYGSGVVRTAVDRALRGGSNAAGARGSSVRFE